MTRAHAKGQAPRSLGSKVRVQTGRRTGAIALPIVLTWSVKIYIVLKA